MDIIVNRKKKRNVTVSLYDYDQLFLELINGYVTENYKPYPDDNFYIKDNRYIIHHNKKRSEVYIDYLIFKVFEKQFNITREESSKILISMIDIHLNLQNKVVSTLNIPDIHKYLEWYYDDSDCDFFNV